MKTFHVFLYCVILFLNCCKAYDTSGWLAVNSQLDRKSDASRWGISSITSILIALPTGKARTYYFVGTMRDCTIHLLDSTFRPVMSTQLSPCPKIGHPPLPGLMKFLCVTHSTDHTLFAWTQSVACTGTNSISAAYTFVALTQPISLWTLNVTQFFENFAANPKTTLMQWTERTVPCQHKCSYQCTSAMGGCLLVDFVNRFEWRTTTDGIAWEPLTAPRQLTGTNSTAVFIANSYHTLQVWVTNCANNDLLQCDLNPAALGFFFILDMSPSTTLVVDATTRSTRNEEGPEQALEQIGEGTMTEHINGEMGMEGHVNEEMGLEGHVNEEMGLVNEEMGTETHINGDASGEDKELVEGSVSTLLNLKLEVERNADVDLGNFDLQSKNVADGGGQKIAEISLDGLCPLMDSNATYFYMHPINYDASNSSASSWLVNCGDQIYYTSNFKDRIPLMERNSTLFNQFWIAPSMCCTKNTTQQQQGEEEGESTQQGTSCWFATFAEFINITNLAQTLQNTIWATSIDTVPSLPSAWKDVSSDFEKSMLRTPLQPSWLLPTCLPNGLVFISSLNGAEWLMQPVYPFDYELTTWYPTDYYRFVDPYNSTKHSTEEFYSLQAIPEPTAVATSFDGQFRMTSYGGSTFSLDTSTYTWEYLGYNHKASSAVDTIHVLNVEATKWVRWLFSDSSWTDDFSQFHRCKLPQSAFGTRSLWAQTVEETPTAIWLDVQQTSSGLIINVFQIEGNLPTHNCTWESVGKLTLPDWLEAAMTLNLVGAVGLRQILMFSLQGIFDNNPSALLIYSTVSRDWLFVKTEREFAGWLSTGPHAETAVMLVTNYTVGHIEHDALTVVDGNGDIAVKVAIPWQNGSRNIQISPPRVPVWNPILEKYILNLRNYGNQATDNGSLSLVMNNLNHFTDIYVLRTPVGRENFENYGFAIHDQTNQVLLWQKARNGSKAYGNQFDMEFESLLWLSNDSYTLTSIHICTLDNIWKYDVSTLPEEMDCWKKTFVYVVTGCAFGVFSLIIIMGVVVYRMKRCKTRRTDEETHGLLGSSPVPPMVFEEDEETLN